MRKADPKDVIVGVAWYREDQWSRLREVATDPETLEETFAEWCEFAEASIQQLRSSGLRIEKIPVDIDELVEWCKDQERPVDGKARAEFANWKLQQKHASPGSPR